MPTAPEDIKLLDVWASELQQQILDDGKWLLGVQQRNDVTGYLVKSRPNIAPVHRWVPGFDNAIATLVDQILDAATLFSGVNKNGLGVKRSLSSEIATKLPLSLEYIIFRLDNPDKYVQYTLKFNPKK